MRSLYYGTGSAPANGAAPTGTQMCSASFIAAGVNYVVPFSVSAVITGLTLNTQIWIDMALVTLAAGTATASAVAISAFEM